jgi:UDPglucose 6-dehydrogenase
MTRVAWVGIGKLGLPCALAMESQGHEVAGWDLSEEVRQQITRREVPYREQAVDELLLKTQLKLTPTKELVPWADIVFLAVQTPHHPRFEGIQRLTDERRDFDYTALVRAVQDVVAAAGNKETTLVVISTVLPGTMRRLVLPLLPPHVHLVYNPFFIAMGTVVRDFLDPEFVLIGSEDSVASQRVKDLYATCVKAGTPFADLTIEEAELVKVAYNGLLGQKITFANTLMEICTKLENCNVDAVTTTLGLAKRRLISTAYTRAGMGDGGSCPRDGIALGWLAQELKLSYDPFTTVMQARERQTEWLADIIIDTHRRSGLPIVLLGLCFKPETNSAVGSPAVLLKNILVERGYAVTAVDPLLDPDGLELPNGFDMKQPAVFFVSTKHECWKELRFHENSVVIDPFRYLDPGCDYLPLGA